MGNILFVGFYIDLLRGIVVVSRHGYRQQTVLYDFNGTDAWRLRLVVGVRDVYGGGAVFRA